MDPILIFNKEHNRCIGVSYNSDAITEDLDHIDKQVPASVILSVLPESMEDFDKYLRYLALDSDENIIYNTEYVEKNNEVLSK